jgi:hypothetical protein
MNAQCLIAKTEQGNQDAVQLTFASSAYPVLPMETMPEMATPTTDALREDDCFATMPEMAAIALDKPVLQPIDEEELHTSFEQAISSRLLAVNRQLDRISGPLSISGQLPPTGSLCPTRSLNQTIAPVAPAVLTNQPEKKHFFAFASNTWQRAMIFSSLTLMSMMAGFDVMGLLILHVH